MSVDVIVGLQRGDEGKGRFVNLRAAEYDIVARFNGGNNAGHTVVLDDERVLKLHQIPSGINYPNVVNVIGNGALINPVKLVEEITDIEDKDIEVSPKNLKVSSAAHLVLPHHISEDEIREAGEFQQGSTKTGIAQVASVKAMRVGVRAEIINNAPDDLHKIIYTGLLSQKKLRELAGLEPIDEAELAALYVEKAKKIGQYITDTVFYLNKELRKDAPARVLAEGAQAFLLDIDHGMYPYTTSTSTTSGGASIGLGIPPKFIEHVTGVVKAVQSHVGGGPFVTEVKDNDMLKSLHGNLDSVDAEYGTTTGRKRRLGFLDIPQIRRSVMVNGVDEMILSKLDWVPRYGENVPVCVEYERKGKALTIAPDSARKLEQSNPIYKSISTWSEDISGIRSFDDLPTAAQDYVNYIEEKVEVPITMLGVGPKPDQYITR